MTDEAKEPSEVEKQLASMTFGGAETATAKTEPEAPPAEVATKAEGKPEPKAPETAEPPAKPEEAKPEAAKADEPENPYKPDSKEHKGWERLRKDAREAREEAKKLRDEMAVFRQQIAQPAAKPERAAEPLRVPPPEELFTSYVKALDNQWGAESENMKRVSRAMIDGLQPAQIMSVLERADAGQFGESSGDIAFQARDALLRANTRQWTEQAAQQSQQQAAAQYRGKVDEATARVLEKYPDIAPDSGSEFSKFIATWREQKLGVNKEGVIVNPDAPLAWMISPTYVNTHPEWPETFAGLARESFDYETAKAAASSVEKERAEKEAKRTPESGAGRGPQAGTSSRMADIERRMASTPISQSLD